VDTRRNVLFTNEYIRDFIGHFDSVNTNVDKLTRSVIADPLPNYIGPTKKYEI
jgi:hypothetical protein